MTTDRLAASFRDPSGFLFTRDNCLYRQVNQKYQPDYERLMSSGLYERLVKARQLVAHEEVNQPAAKAELAYKIIQPERVPFISYPYEWSFSQLRDAALLTLSIQKKALDAGMSLKDASAYNVQFLRGKATLIDTLSFEVYQEGRPWVAYRQFCQHFLAPLALMAKVDVRLNQLLRIYIDGVPLDLAARLLPWSTRLNGGLLAHLHLHARAQQRYAGKDQPEARPVVGGMSRNALIGLIESLEKTVRGLSWTAQNTEWGDYYDATNYTADSLDRKADMVAAYLEKVQPQTVWDLGGNTGRFSRIASERGIFTVCADIDPAAVEKNYRDLRKNKETNLLPLLLDLTNPSPALGWANQERDSLGQRGPADLVMALALVHHLAISNNVPLTDIARSFAGLAKWLIIEFIPKEDSQVRRLLATREDIFGEYHAQGFEAAFETMYTICEKQPVEGSLRTLYLMERKN